MGRVASAETQLRRMKRELQEAKVARHQMMGQRDAYRARATKAEQETAEWKNRFDALLLRAQFIAPPTINEQPNSPVERRDTT